MKKRWVTYVAALFSIVLILAACGGKKESSDSVADDKNDDKASTEEKYIIGVTQIVEHPSLNAAFEGFKKAIEDAGLNVEYDKQNAQNDNSANTTIANNLVGADVDLIFANSTPSAQAAASATQDIPIVFTSVTDAVGAELLHQWRTRWKRNRYN